MNLMMTGFRQNKAALVFVAILAATLLIPYNLTPLVDNGLRFRSCAIRL
jgi:hypothetical protein